MRLACGAVRAVWFTTSAYAGRSQLTQEPALADTHTHRGRGRGRGRDKHRHTHTTGYGATGQHINAACRQLAKAAPHTAGQTYYGRLTGTRSALVRSSGERAQCTCFCLSLSLSLSLYICVCVCVCVCVRVCVCVCVFRPRTPRRCAEQGRAIESPALRQRAATFALWVTLSGAIVLSGTLEYILTHTPAVWEPWAAPWHGTRCEYCCHQSSYLPRSGDNSATAAVLGGERPQCLSLSLCLCVFVSVSVSVSVSLILSARCVDQRSTNPYASALNSRNATSASSSSSETRSSQLAAVRLFAAVSALPGGRVNGAYSASGQITLQARYALDLFPWWTTGQLTRETTAITSCRAMCCGARPPT
jgi:hypothetical protein